MLIGGHSEKEYDWKASSLIEVRKRVKASLLMTRSGYAVKTKERSISPSIRQALSGLNKVSFTFKVVAYHAWPSQK